MVLLHSRLLIYLGIVRPLDADLRRSFPDMSGRSPRNLKSMVSVTTNPGLLRGPILSRGWNADETRINSFKYDLIRVPAMTETDRL